MRLTTLFCTITVFANACTAQTMSATQPTSAPRATTSTTSVKPNATPMTIAIFDFDSNLPGNPDLGKQAAEALNALLSGQDGFRLVDRAQLNRTLSEQELSLTGLVEQDKAIKVGQIVGAKLLVTGKIFALDKTIFVTTKIIGTETTLVEGVLVKAKVGADTGDLIANLADKLEAKLEEAAPRLVASPVAKVDPLVAIKDRLSKKTKPVVMIQVSEHHIGEAPRAEDPPVDTELRSMFTACGFTVVDPAETTPVKAKAGLIIKGEAFSEFAARIQNFRSCTARAELSLVNAADGSVITSTRTTARAADLSENIAGKAALQLAGNQAGLELLQKLAETLPDH